MLTNSCKFLNVNEKKLGLNGEPEYGVVSKEKVSECGLVQCGLVQQVSGCRVVLFSVELLFPSSWHCCGHAGLGFGPGPTQLLE